MADKPKAVSSGKHVPKDAQVIISIIKDMGIIDYESKVINQLLEFSYRYVTCILEDSKIYANHAKKKSIDIEDVRLAVKLQLNRTYTNPPPRDVLIEIAKARNTIALPLIKPSIGLRLPPDRYCLNNPNYKLKALKKSVKTDSNSSFIQSRLNHKGFSLVKRPGTLPNVIKTQTISMPKANLKILTDTTSNLNFHMLNTPDDIKSKIDLDSAEVIKKKKEIKDYDDL